MKKTTKALSPIFATLVILAVVTVLFIPVFIWATGMTSQTEDSWETSGTIATERIVIEEVSLKAGTASCTIYVRNIGKTAVSVDNVFISLSDGTGVLHVYSLPTFTTSPSSVVQGDLITVTFADPNLGFIPSANETYNVKVFTTLGVGDAYQVVT
jgi:archaellum component FlaG (FlaF/FlaG flagellin family)